MAAVIRWRDGNLYAESFDPVFVRVIYVAGNNRQALKARRLPGGLSANPPPAHRVRGLSSSSGNAAKCRPRIAGNIATLLAALRSPRAGPVKTGPSRCLWGS